MAANNFQESLKVTKTVRISKFIWQQISDWQALCSLLVIVCSDIAYTAHVWHSGACICYKNVQHLRCVGAVMCDISYVNSVHVINQNPRVTAINSCIEVDLTGQVCADSIGTRMYSGPSVRLSVCPSQCLSMTCMYNVHLSRDCSAIIRHWSNFVFD